MKPSHVVTRSNVNENVVNAPDMPKSGFNLSYKSAQDYILGRIHVSGYQHIMPSDKFNGVNKGDFTFNRLAQNVPLIGDIEVCQHNFYLPYRAIDTSFEDGLTPTKLNSMSSSWKTPSFSLATLCRLIFADWLELGNHNLWRTMVSATATNEEWTEMVENLTGVVSELASSEDELPMLRESCEQNYLLDWYFQYINHIKLVTDSIDETLDRNEYRFLFYDAVLTPLVGRNSLLDTLGYNYLRKSDVLALSKKTTTVTGLTPANIMGENCDAIEQCEYALRAYYAVWYEYFRDINLEPVSANLPNWKKFGSTSQVCNNVGSESTYFINVGLLVPRIRSWQKDMFVSAQIDDICRHVFAPVQITDFNGDEGKVFGNSFSYNFDEVETVDYSVNRNIAIYNLSYLSADGTNSCIATPIPKSINDVLSSSVNLDFFDNGDSDRYLDLMTLRRSQMLEKYLKRNYYFGDEYRDRMLAHYGSKVSDLRVNRPELLSSSVDMINRNQVMSTVSTSESNVGDRTITATANSKGDGYTYFAEEFGIVLNLISFMPIPQYAGVCPQNLMSIMTDFPLPEFANQNEEFSRVMEIATSGLKKTNVFDLGTFGHHPYAHAWRSRVNEVHGSFLDDKQDWTFRRYFGLDDESSSPKLNYEFIHCNPNLGMFVDSDRLNGQLYGEVVHDFFVERVLPTPVENI